MRVLITTDVLGGVWSYTEELVDALVDRGHDVSLVAFGGSPRPGQLAWLRRRPALDFTPVDSPLEWMPEPGERLRASVDALRAEVARVGPDVVHLNQFYYGAFDLGAPKLLVAHSDVLSWWAAVKETPPPADDAWLSRYRGWVHAGLSGADARVAPSAWLASRVEAIYGVRPVRVIYNGRSPERFDSPARVPRGDRVVAVGRLWDEAKGARDLIPAAERLGGGVPVVVAGPAEHPAGGEDFPTDAPGIEWVGALDADEVGPLLRSASVYAATSRYEPFGLAPLEAALSGCALVASDIPTFRELWDGCAWFYPAGDAAGLARAIGDALRDGPDRRARIRAARARVREWFSVDRMIRNYEMLYHDLVERTSKQPS